MTPRLMLLAAGAAALALGACERTETRTETETKADGGASLRTVSKLECPQEQGELTLVSAAEDGRTCEYGAENAEVTLRLVSLSGMQPKAALDPIEADLKTLIPPPEKREPAEEPQPTDKAAEKTGDRAEIDMPGLRIRADDTGADIRIGSLRIDADEGGAEVRVGDETVVNANEDAAEIRTVRGGDNIQATYILAREKAAEGYHVVGYEARGPKTGPLVVAVVKARRDEHNRHDLFDDMKDLVELNVGR